MEIKTEIAKIVGVSEICNHSAASDIRLCHNSRKCNCKYFYDCELDIENFKISVRICLREYRKNGGQNGTTKENHNMG